TTGNSYWEGAVKATGFLKGKPVKAKGYLELKGY
nr:carotenoid 1,2-hydratase [Leptospiraceae bacterium]